MLPLSGLGQRPYRSKKQKPCNACRRRRAGCIREGSFACAFCTRRNLDCVVEPDLQAQRGNLDSLKNSNQRARASPDSVSPQDSTRCPATTSNRPNPANHPRSNSSCHVHNGVRRMDSFAMVRSFSRRRFLLRRIIGEVQNSPIGRTAKRFA